MAFNEAKAEPKLKFQKYNIKKSEIFLSSLPKM